MSTHGRIRQCIYFRYRRISISQFKFIGSKIAGIPSPEARGGMNLLEEHNKLVDERSSMLSNRYSKYKQQLHQLQKFKYL